LILNSKAFVMHNLGILSDEQQSVSEELVVMADALYLVLELGLLIAAALIVSLHLAGFGVECQGTIAQRG
jgi:hypothetical protein